MDLEITKFQIQPLDYFRPHKRTKTGLKSPEDKTF